MDHDCRQVVVALVVGHFGENAAEFVLQMELVRENDVAGNLLVLNRKVLAPDDDLFSEGDLSFELLFLEVR